MPNPPENLNKPVVTSHAIVIAVNGVHVGLIQAWNPAQNRGLTFLYELDADTSGDVIDVIPGNMGGQTITVNRYELYNARMEQVFGNVDAEMLSDINQPFKIRELTRRPGGGGVEARVYHGCWFASVGRTYSATGDRLVLVNATLNYTRKERVSP